MVLSPLLFSALPSLVVSRPPRWIGSECCLCSVAVCCVPGSKGRSVLLRKRKGIRVFLSGLLVRVRRRASSSVNDVMCAAWPTKKGFNRRRRNEKPTFVCGLEWTVYACVHRKPQGQRTCWSIGCKIGSTRKRTTSKSPLKSASLLLLTPSQL